MRGFIATDEKLTLTAPAGGVTADVPVQVGDLVVVPVASTAAGTQFVGLRRGVVELPKGAVALTEGQTVGWSRANGNVIALNPDFALGQGVRAAVASDARVRVVLKGT